MKLALWNLPPADLLRLGFEAAELEDVEIIRERPEVCAALLIQQNVDVALMPTSMVLKAADALDVIPGLALSAWSYPFAKVVLQGGMRDWPDEVLYDKRAVQEQLVARIVLHEHYGIEPTFVADGGAARPRSDSHRAVLLTGPEAYEASPDDLALDIGREWFELANYPMVWGLLVTRKDHLEPDQVQRLVDVAQIAEDQRGRMLASIPSDDPLYHFVKDDVRLRFDDLATASLTEFKRYLFYYDIVEEISSLRFADVPESDAEEGEEPLV